MKKWLWKTGLCTAGLLLMGTAAISTVDKLMLEPLTVESSSELVEKYIKVREQWGPIVPPSAMYSDVAEQMSKGDWSFLKENWFFKFDDGVLYVPEKSALAKVLKLPARIQMREDMKTGQIYIFSAPLTDGKTGVFTGIAASPAPAFMQYEKDFPLDRFLSDELSPRRIVWEITLKPESDAWSDLLFQRDASVASAKLLEGGGMMSMVMSIPPEQTTNIWLCLEPQEGGINLNVFAPEGFTNRVEIYSCTDLVAGIWEIAVQNLYPSGTNPAVWDATSTLTNRFFAAGNMDIPDTDGDGLLDAREKYIYKTDPNNADTDGDGMPDGWELQYGFNPLFYADGGFDLDGDGLTNLEEYQHGTNPTVADTDGDGLTDGLEVHTWGTDPTKADTDDDQMPDYWEVTHGLNPLVNDASSDPDGDGVSNLAEYIAGTHPMIAAGSQGGLVYHYDEDGRLTDAQFNGNAAAWYGSSPVQNLTGINIYTGN